MTPELEDIRTLGCEVVPVPYSRCVVWEPISWTAPSIAEPWRSPQGEVIFYLSPRQWNRKTSTHRVWERRQSLLPWGALFLYDGKLWSTAVNYVCRRRGGWWMRHAAWEKQPHVIPAFAKCAERRARLVEEQ
jgi:hypothetical protein